MQRIRRHLTYANVASLIAIIAATGGTAFAAANITGASILDSSLTTIDFKNGSLEKADIATTSFTSMRGAKGKTGDAGTKGGTGSNGLIGDRGDAGKSAHSLVRYATYASPSILANAAATPNPGGLDWDDEAYPDYAGATSFPNFDDDVPTAFAPVPITHGEPVLLQLTGNNHVTTGTIKPTSSGLLSATATLTIMHQYHGQSDHAGGMPLHGRVRCRLRYANNGQSIGAGSTQLGASEWMSSRRRHRLYTVTLTGSEKVTATNGSNFNVGVSCADVDRTGSNQWMFISGNVVAHAVYIES